MTVKLTFEAVTSLSVKVAPATMSDMLLLSRDMVMPFTMSSASCAAVISLPPSVVSNSVGPPDEAVRRSALFAPNSDITLKENVPSPLAMT